MTDEVRFDVQGAIGCITLDRQRALNALTLEMIRAMQVQLDSWKEDPKVAAVLIEGAGEKAFCAGGDVVTVRRSRLEAGDTGKPTTLMLDFFGDEYRLNRSIADYPKPYIALLDGVTMGGGVGISVHGDFRIVSERTLFAMPETGIGLFPDVGGGWFLPRCPGETGTYLALTGVPVKAADCLYIGAATHFVPGDSLQAMRNDLLALEFSGDAAEPITRLLAEYATPCGSAPLAGHRSMIDSVFSYDRMEDIRAALEADDGSFGRETAALLDHRSPTSLKVTLEMMRRGARCASLAEDLEMEFTMVQSFMLADDFFEGVRALLVDKDRAPKWSPTTLDEVTPEAVAGYFSADGKIAL